MPKAYCPLFCDIHLHRIIKISHRQDLEPTLNTPLQLKASPSSEIHFDQNKEHQIRNRIRFHTANKDRIVNFGRARVSFRQVLGTLERLPRNHQYHHEIKTKDKYISPVFSAPGHILLLDTSRFQSADVIWFTIWILDKSFFLRELLGKSYSLRAPTLHLL